MLASCVSRLIFEGADPEQPEVGKHDSLVDPLLIQEGDARRRVDVVGRHGLLEGGRRRLSSTLAGAVRPHRGHVPGRLGLGQVDAPSVRSGQPGISQLVVGDPQCEVLATRGQVVGPQGPGFEQVSVGIDHFHAAERRFSHQNGFADRSQTRPRA